MEFQKGTRKAKVNIITMLFLLAGLIIAGWMEMDFQIYLCYAAGCTGANIGFMWGNSQTHKYQGTSKE